MAILQHILLLGLFILTVIGTDQNDERPLVTTKDGQLRGFTVPVKETSRVIHGFYGIPFAKPPVGLLRFANPQPPEPWTCVRDASVYPPMCIQDVELSKKLAVYYRSSITLPPISEDCLYLNVYTPADRDQETKLPVMVFIHGGGLVFGTGSTYDGSALSAYENVVVVTLQYRLGIPGFLSTGDEKLPGNYGFMDQIAALQWVQGNIANFGGDPKCVTIFGESAGGISVSALILSPLAKGLFHRAIAESGAATMPSFMVSSSEELIPYQQLVAQISGCDLASIADCLKQKSEEEILSITKAMGVTPLPGCVDGVFLHKPVEEIMANMEGNKVPLLIGMNNQEFGMIIPLLYGIPVATEGMTRESVIQTLQNIPILGLNQKDIPLIVDTYLDGTTDPQVIRNRFLDLCGDVMFGVPILKTAKYHRDMGAPLYFYQFEHPPSLLADGRPEFVKVDHTVELISVFGGPFLQNGEFLSGPATPEEKTLSQNVMKYWVNFSRNGDPNSSGLTTWLPFGNDENYMLIDLVQIMSSKPKEKEYIFFTETLPAKTQSQAAGGGEI